MANRTLKNEFTEERIENNEQLESLKNEKKALNVKVEKAKELLEEQERKNRYLATFHTKLQDDLDKKTAEVNDVLGKFNDENHQMLRNLQKEVKEVILSNKELKEYIKQTKNKCDELSKNAALTEGNLVNTLVEFN